MYFKSFNIFQNISTVNYLIIYLIILIWHLNFIFFNLKCYYLILIIYLNFI